MASIVSTSRRAITALAVAAAFVAPSVAAEQTPLSVTVTVTTSIAVAVGSILDFGTIIPGASPTIDAGSATVGVGRYDIAAANNAPIDLSVQFPATLTNGVNPALTLNTYTAATAQTVAGIRTSLVGGGGQIRSGSAISSGTGALFVYVGAKVNTLGATPASTYNGTVLLTATYP